MRIRLSSYHSSYRLASLATTEESLMKMNSYGFRSVYIDGNNLLFHPEKVVVQVSQEDADKLREICDFSILEFMDEAVYIAYDASKDDNVIFITNRCNSNCIMCPVSEQVRRRAEIMELPYLLTICRQIPDDIHHLTITGGEPFLLHEGMFKLLQTIKQRLDDTEILLLTNGRAFADKNYVDKLCETMPSKLLIGIPVHGSNETRHDFITQAPGSFRETYLGLKHLLAQKMSVEVRIVVSKLNYQDMTNIADLLINNFNRVKVVRFMGLEMLGNAHKNSDQVWIDYNEAFKAIETAVKKLLIAGIDVSLYNFPLCSVKKGYWTICEKSISEHKVRFLDECEECNVKALCGGIFAGSINQVKGSIKAIR